MLSQQQELPLSEYSSLYDIVVPQANLLRRINDVFLWSHAKEILKGHIITGTLYDIYVRNIVYGLQQKILEHANRGFCCSTIILAILIGKFLIDKSEIYKIINASSLCKFRKLRLEDMDLMNLLIQKSVEIAIEKGIIKSRTIIVDATHTEARSNPYSPIEILRLRSK